MRAKEVLEDLGTFQPKLICNIARLVCDCGAEMASIGMHVMKTPPEFDHKCPSCGNETVIAGKEYPYFKYIEQ